MIVAALIYSNRHPLEAPFIPAGKSMADISATTPLPDLTPAAAPAQTIPASVCYLLDTPAASGGKNVVYLKMTSTDGQNATGELGTFLDQKDGMTGTLSGTLSAGSAAGDVVFDGQYSNMAEGVSNVTEQTIEMTETQAEVSYGTSALTLPAVDCGQYDSLKAATGH